MAGADWNMKTGRVTTGRLLHARLRLRLRRLLPRFDAVLCLGCKLGGGAEQSVRLTILRSLGDHPHPLNLL